MEYPHRQASLSVDNIRSDIPQKEVERVIARARKELAALGGVRVAETDPAYRQAICD